MSSRIRADASGPGEDARRSAPEPAERDNVETASDGREPEEASQQPRDGSAGGTEGVEPRERPRDAPAEDPDKPAVTEPDQPARDPEIQRRIDQLTRDRYEARRERDEARAQMAEWQRQQQRQQQPAGPEREAEERAYQRIQQERVQEDFNRQCNDLWERGVGEYGQEMQEAKRGLDAVGWGGRPDALAALTALPDGHRIYRELAGDLDNAARILSLPPMRMAVELARMSRPEGANASNADNVSRETHREPLSDRRTRAPEPLRPIGGNSARADRPLTEVSMAEFIRRRDREERGSRIRR